MDTAAFVGLVGVALGWLLGLGTELWLQRRLAKRSARLLAAELIQNASAIKSLREAGAATWAISDWTLSNAAWAAHATNVFSLLSEGEGMELQKAYVTRDVALRVAGVWINANQDHIREARHGNRSARHGPSGKRARGRAAGKPKSPNDRYIDAIKGYMAGEDERYERSLTNLRALVTRADEQLAQWSDQFEAAGRLVSSKS